LFDDIMARVGHDGSKPWIAAERFQISVFFHTLDGRRIQAMVDRFRKQTKGLLRVPTEPMRSFTWRGAN